MNIFYEHISLCSRKHIFRTLLIMLHYSSNRECALVYYVTKNNIDNKRNNWHFNFEDIFLYALTLKEVSTISKENTQFSQTSWNRRI